jgi:hypothetical protein
MFHRLSQGSGGLISEFDVPAWPTVDGHFKNYLSPELTAVMKTLTFFCGPEPEYSGHLLLLLLLLFF